MQVGWIRRNHPKRILAYVLKREAPVIMATEASLSYVPARKIPDNQRGGKCLAGWPKTTRAS